MKFYTPVELAESLQLNVATIYKAVKNGHLKAITIGNRYRISEEHFQAWLADPQTGE